MVNFKRLRENMGLSQPEAAIKAGVSIGTISGLELGRVDVRSMQGRTRRALVAFYGIDLVTGEPAQAQEPQPASSPAA